MYLHNSTSTPGQHLAKSEYQFRSNTNLSSLVLVDECRKRVRPSSPTPKKVSFSPVCQTVIGIRRQDYTVAETEACWYTEDESTVIRTKSIRIIKKMIDGTAKGLCTRGLEHLSPVEADARKERREDAYDAVMYEQETQYNNGVSNPQRIASLYYESASFESQRIAQEMGAHDAIVAMRIHNAGAYSHDAK